MIDFIEHKRAVVDSFVEYINFIPTKDLISHILFGLDSSYWPFNTMFMVEDDATSVDDLVGLLFQEKAWLEHDHLR